MTELARIACAARAALLDDLAARIDADPPFGEGDFRDAVKALTVAGVQVTAIAREAHVAIPTVTRWAQGRTSPHRGMRRVLALRLPAVARALAAELRRDALPALREAA